ncbi:limbin-like isoform X1 [Hippocampus zosterae]|uniref:limbin-like isoform X1 n=1 Tax=Hippocampus zosterae TaxID=109293 RepID=UPI00223CA6E0|nr:limbin-like isoform X1 [Hippocampus zosterae]
MLLVQLMAEKVTIWSILVNLQVSCFYPPSPSSSGCPNAIPSRGPGVACPELLCNGTLHDTCWCSSLPTRNPCNKYGSISSYSETKHIGGNPPGLQLHAHCKMDFQHAYSAERPVFSSASPDPWAHSVYTPFSHMKAIFQLRDRRSSLTRYDPGHTLPQLQSLTPPASFKVKFLKCAQVLAEADPPQLTFFLLIHNLSPEGGTNLSQVAIRDSIFGIVPLKTEGRVVERGYQVFAIDSLSAGSQMILNYTAQIRSHKRGVLDLPAFLTFSNLSQNDVSMFGPLTANLTLRVNSTDRIYPNHGVHFAGFIGGFFVALVLLLLGFLAMNLIGPRTRLHFLQQRKNRGDPDPEYADCDMTETVKDEATFEDRIVDIMVLEEPQNMNQALENLEMSTLLHATNNLEATRIQIYKDVLSLLLGGLRYGGQVSLQAQQRLLSVLHGQLLGMEGRLKEERGARMATLAAKCNLETREEMESEHRRAAAEKAQAELLCQHAEQQELLQCSVLLEKLHKLSQAHLQRSLLVRHEEASAKLQRQIIEWRRVELHKIFSEELEEATKMGELEKTAAGSLQHSYFQCQDLLEETLDVILANWRFVLAERHAQRKFLLHSLHSLNSLLSDTFASTSSNLDSMFAHIRRGSTVSAEKLTQLQEKAQKDLVMVRQRLDDALSQEKRAMRCGLVRKRRELISDMLRVHMQRQKDLSALSKNQDGGIEIAQHLHCWRDLLTTHSLELAELINNLDEEAAADIRKVTMRVIQSSMADVKAIQPSTMQALLTILPPSMQHSLLQVEPEAGQGGSTLLQGQEMLHQEGKVALHTLSTTRESLNRAMERELQEQKELRAHCREFFRSLCSSQLTLSGDERLAMKLEFQKCLSVMDRCLMLPHAVSRTKIHTWLANWRKDSEQQVINPHLNGKAGKKKQDASNLVHFRKTLHDQIQMLEKEMDSGIINKVEEEMKEEREDYLHSQADSLAMQMAAVHYQKAERRNKVLETSRALHALHGLLIHHLRETKNLARQEMAQSIQKHCLGLEEAERRLQEETGELDRLETVHWSNQPHTEDADATEEGREEEQELFGLKQESRMTSILQEALDRCDQVIAALTLRLQEMTTGNQTMEDLREQMALKRLYSNCDQDLLFASELVKQCRVPVEVLLELLRLLVPTIPESELLSITDALCPKQNLGSSSSEHEHSGANLHLPVRLKEDLVHRSMPNMPHAERERSQRLQEKRESLMERLLPRSRLALAEKGKEDNFMKEKLPGYKSAIGENTRRHSEAPSQGDAEKGNETRHSSAEEDVLPTSANGEVICQASGERLFVFRDPPQSHISICSPRRKKKRNFLNLKKGCVAPTTQT